MGTRGGVSSVGSKEADKAKECGFGLGLRMQAKESCLIMSHYHRPSHLLSSSSSSSSSGCGFDGGGGGDGPMFYSRSNPVACFGDTYAVVGTGSGSGSAAIDAMGRSKSLQPFSSSSFTFNPSSSGQMTRSVNVRVPFTAAQRQELERQTMIYKFMMASVPVPPELLIPISRTQSNTSSSQSQVVKGSLEFGIASCNSDPEPWRCKRTDGKKWRCSRDVAPDQRYCERHSHKSRPRSRKPVELHTHSMANNTNSYITTDTNLLTQKPHFPSQANPNFSIFSSAMVSAATSYDQPKNLDWFLKGDSVAVASGNANQEWQHLKGDSTKCDENSYLNIRGSHSLQAHRLNDNCSLLLSPKSASVNPSNQTQAQETRCFLDAWSSGIRESSSAGGIGNEYFSVPSGEKLLPLSSLTLSMSGGSEENENGQAIIFGMIGSEKEDGGVLRPPQWMSHGSWMGSPPGGPLAEALCLSISSSEAKADSNLTSSHGSSCGHPSGIDSKS